MIKNISLGILIIMVCFLIACNSNQNKTEAISPSLVASETMKQKFKERLQKHLDAVSNKDIQSLKETMSPDGDMQLMMPKAEILYTVDSFINFHAEWFKDTTWSFETKIISSSIGPKMGFATTQIIYREPLRNGAPYFNRMIVTYGLENKNGEWYITSDHASSIEKSTDKK